MNSVKSRFDCFALALDFGAPQVSQIRESLSLLLPRLGELVASFDAALKRDVAGQLFPGLEGEQRERLQSLIASFILRTINCNFDDAFCEFAAEVSGTAEIPPGFFAFGLSMAQDFVCGALPSVQRDPTKLAEMLTAWNRLIAALKEITRK